jgi:hypothetical protein
MLNGRVEQRLADDEQWQCSPRWGGRNGEWGVYFPTVVAFIGGGERGGLGRPLGSATDASVEPESATGGTRWVPLLWVANVWARGRYLKVA